MQPDDRIARYVALTLLLVTLVGTAIACVVIVPDVFLLTFLAVLFGVFLSYTASYLVRWLPLGYGWNLGLLVVLICLAPAFGAYFLAPAIDAQITSAGKQIDRSASQMGKWLQERPYTGAAFTKAPFLDDFLKADRSNRSESERSPSNSADSADSRLIDGASRASGAILMLLSRMFSTTLGLLTSFAYVVFVGLFLAANPSLYRNGLVSLFTERSQAQVRDILDKIGQQLYRWLGGRMLTMLITGLGTGLAMWVLGVPLAGSVGILTALLTFIPNVGAAIAFVFACMMALTQGATTVIWVIALYLLLQLLESNVVTPLIQQRQTSIPPALLLAFQLLMGMLTGFLGLMVATPLLAAGMVIVKETWQSRKSGVH